MPWGTIIVGMGLLIGAYLGMSHIVTGTAQSDSLIRDKWPVFVGGLLLILFATALFGGHKK
jgi:hypothetical protein